MGLHTGEASVGTDGYVGFAVHQAARIGDAGHGGQVLLSSTTANLVRHDLPGELGLLDLGPTVLPDFDRPERLFQLEIPGLALEFPPLSTREREKARPRIPRRRTDVQVSSWPLLERDAEVATLQAVVAAAVSGAGRVVAIEGRAGMGKTRLVAEARSLAAGAGFEVLLARSADLEQEFAYGVVRQLFEPLLASLPPQERDEVLAGTAGLSERLFGDEELTGATGGRRLVRGHARALLARGQPRRPAADGARDRRPALGGRVEPALAVVPQPPARGAAAAGRAGPAPARAVRRDRAPDRADLRRDRARDPAGRAQRGRP